MNYVEIRPHPLKGGLAGKFGLELFVWSERGDHLDEIRFVADGVFDSRMDALAYGEGWAKSRGLPSVDQAGIYG
jgi:hypothetical protein